MARATMRLVLCYAVVFAGPLLSSIAFAWSFGSVGIGATASMLVDVTPADPATRLP